MGFFSWLGGGPDDDKVSQAQKLLEGEGGPAQGAYLIGGAKAHSLNNLDMANRLNAQQYNTDLANSARGQQQGALSLYQNAASGRGPSAATAGLNRSLGLINNQLQAQAFAQQGRGGAGLSQRNLLNAQVAAANNTQANTGLARAQEQQGAMAGYAQAAGNLRASDIGVAAAQYSADSQRNQQVRDLYATRYNQDLNDAQFRVAQDQARVANVNNRAGLMERYAYGEGAAQGRTFDKIASTAGAIGQAIALSDMTAKNVTQSPNAAADSTQGFLTRLASLGNMPGPGDPRGNVAHAPQQGSNSIDDAWGKIKGAIEQKRLNDASTALSSDRSIKQNVQGGGSEAEQFLDHLKPYGYTYKDPQRHGEGERLGIMAQDADKSEMGQDMVVKGPDGKLGIDVNKGLSAALASVAYLNKELEQLKSQRGHAAHG